MTAARFAGATRIVPLSTRATVLVQARYARGDVNYFEVVDASRQSLAAERAAINARGQRFNAAVALIRALGGGWQ